MQGKIWAVMEDDAVSQYSICTLWNHKLKGWFAVPLFAWPSVGGDSLCFFLLKSTLVMFGGGVTTEANMCLQHVDVWENVAAGKMLKIAGEPWGFSTFVMS